jgi:hypothetical protein
LEGAQTGTGGKEIANLRKSQTDAPHKKTVKTEPSQEDIFELDDEHNSSSDGEEDTNTCGG